MSSPRLSRWLLGLLLPARLRAFVLDDLEEEFRARVSASDPAVARGWYRRQVRRGVGAALRLRYRALVTLAAGVEGRVFRRLRRSPGFAIVTILTLTLALAANATIFTLVNAILLRPLPHPRPEELVVIKHAMPAMGVADALQSTGTYFHYREHAVSFVDMGLYQMATVNVTGEGEPRQVSLIMATPSVFTTLATTPLLGRLFTEADVAADADPVLVLSHALWRERYGADVSVVGRRVLINDRPREIVGVLPPRFDFPSADAVMWMSNGDVTRSAARFGDLFFGNVARLRTGVSAAEATAELRSLAASLGDAYADITPEMIASSGFTARAVGLGEEVVGNVDERLWMLFAAVALVGLIAAANVANLFLVRSEYRGSEIAVRQALGASRAQLFLFQLAESIVLSLAGAAAGLAVGRAAVAYVVAVGPRNLPRLYEVGIDARVVGFTVLLALLAAVAFTLVAAWRHRVASLPRALQCGMRGAVRGTASRRVGGALVAGQAALAVALLVIALLLVQSFSHLRAVDTGFDSDDVLTIDFALPRRAYPDYDSSADLFRTLQERIAALPGVVAVSGVGSVPLAPPQFPPTAMALQVEGKTLSAGEIPPVARVEFFLQDYFELLDVALPHGAVGSDSATVAPEFGAVINASLAQQLFGSESAVGRRFRTVAASGEGGPWWTVSAVAADVLYDGITAPPPSIVYLPVLERRSHPLLQPGAMSIVVRAAEPEALVPAIRATVREVDSDLPIANVRTLDEVVASASAHASFTMVLLVTAALAAVFLGAVGVYGVTSYAVGQRTREIGVRMALGASAGAIRGMVMRQVAVVLVAGLAGGLLAAAMMARVAAGMLYGVRPVDPLAFTAAPLLLLAIALLATFLPARRAARVDPLEALRGRAL